MKDLFSLYVFELIYFAVSLKGIIFDLKITLNFSQEKFSLKDI